MKVVGICGSLRTKSRNRKLYKLIVKSLEGLGCEVEEAKWDEIQIYNGDVEELGIPESVTSFKNLIKNANGIVVVSPEYNWSIPGGVKNAIDWATRPPKEIKEVFHNQVLLQAGVSDGALGTARAISHWLNVWQTLRLVVSTPPLRIADEEDNGAFDENGNLIRESDQKALESSCLRFVELLKKLK